MIKLEHTVLPSPEQMQFIIEGMRNPMNSWGKSDSYIDRPNSNCNGQFGDPFHVLGENDQSLMKRLANAGTDHRKFMRMIPVYVRITAPLYWWKEFDTYKVGTVANSCSTMHKIQENEFTIDDFSHEHLLDYESKAWDDVVPTALLNTIVNTLNVYRSEFLRTKDKHFWWQMIQLLPSSYNQTRNVMLNYEVLANIYKSRKNHKLDEWRQFCSWIKTLPYSSLIIKED